MIETPSRLGWTEYRERGLVVLSVHRERQLFVVPATSPLRRDAATRLYRALEQALWPTIEDSADLTGEVGDMHQFDGGAE